ncbi:type I restriction endonuclease subunit R [Holdemanella biformis]|uniref:type I restriction endonuclease subunit R n=1 Tax=Holdemanella biformis TaxID=1735 RepID=UPI003079CB55
MVFNKESAFEEALIKILCKYGWSDKILKYPTEEDLIQNWANILFENNRDIDRLNDYPLTRSEMQQIIAQINELRTPLKLNSFINGKTVSIKRDNPDDKLHFGKEISLKIYDRMEIAAGSSRYQIAQQPIYKSKSKILNDRRGDLTLLINGMPVIHIELKKSGVPISQAQYQIEKYAKEGIFTGLFSLVQIFVAMNPDETTYFANPGPDGKFNSSYYFHWADFNNERIDQWDKIGATLLSIPMAHEMIGFYTVADDSDGILKVMRSYQYYAASRISDKVAKNKWDDKNQLGGYVWHTTGSGKTLTSFKSAQLIASSKDADKVVFLMDRIELGTQSLKEYRAFADFDQDVQDTEDTYVLISKLKSDDPANTLIVTSIQKMSNIGKDSNVLKQKDLDKMSSKRIVFIVDECHRSTFGDMLLTIKETFPKALFFGFTGTPIQDENQKKMNTTTDIFGDELHRYSIADGIRDGNVLGFDPYKVLTFKDMDLREAVALAKANANSRSEALQDESKAKIYNHYMNKSKVKMITSIDENGKTVHGIEDFVSNQQYMSDEHQNIVVDDIVSNFDRVSHNKKFHAIFATSSIPEAIEYYRLFKSKAPTLKVTALFDQHIDNVAGFQFKEDGLVELIDDYNSLFNQDFKIATFDKMKKDIAARLAHKKPYERIELNSNKQIDILIVVNQMLTGFDSKWINTLYLDKMIEYENIIQAFSRTNRLFGPDKPFGIIRYYRRPHTMEENISKAIKLYSGDKPFGLFANKLNYNLKVLNDIFCQIKLLFENVGITDFEKLPYSSSDQGQFAKLFNEFNKYIQAAYLQGMVWDKSEYVFDNQVDLKETVVRLYDEKTYLILVQRYKELFTTMPGTDPSDNVFDIQSYITEIDTGFIDNDYMNSKFNKYVKILSQPGITEDEINKVKDEVHKTFATLSAEEQKYANIILHDIEAGDFTIKDDEKTLRDYITDYMNQAKNDQIHKMADALGLDEQLLRECVLLKLNKTNLNEFGRFDKLLNTVDKSKARQYFERAEQKKILPPKVNMKVSNLLTKFILEGGFDIE